MSETREEKALREAVEVDEALAYVQRGRVLKAHGDDEISTIWAACVERWFRDPTEASQRHMDDAAAEMRLRGLLLPYDRLGGLLDEISDAHTRVKARPVKDEMQAQFEEFVGGRKKPQN